MHITLTLHTRPDAEIYNWIYNRPGLVLLNKPPPTFSVEVGLREIMHRMLVAFLRILVTCEYFNFNLQQFTEFPRESIADQIILAGPKISP